MKTYLRKKRISSGLDKEQLHNLIIKISRGHGKNITMRKYFEWLVKTGQYK
jgi:hypothetical protein